MAVADLSGSPHDPAAHYDVQSGGRLVEVDVKGSKTRVIEIVAKSDRTLVMSDAANVASDLL